MISVWYGYDGQCLHCVSHRFSKVVSLLQRYRGGTESKLGNWLLSRAEDEVLITIESLRLFSWDCRERMATS